MRELYEADSYKPGIYGSGRVWANAWDVFRLKPSRGGRGRRAAVDFVVCFGCGEISRFQTRKARAVSVDSVKGQRQPVNLPTENSRPPIPTTGEPFLVRAHLRIMASLVLIAHSPSQCLIFDLTNPTSIHFQAPRAHIVQHQTSGHCSRDRALRQTYSGMSRHTCSDPLDASAVVRGCSVGCTLGMSDITFGVHRSCLLYTSPSPRD